MAKKIDLKQIESRLGPAKKADPYADFEFVPKQQQEVIHDTESDDSAVSLYVGIGSVIVAVAVGMLWLMTGDSIGGISWTKFRWAPEPVSVADQYCGVNWVQDANNSVSMMCYLTQNISRLCDAQEKQILVSRFNRYETEREQFKNEMMGMLIATQMAMVQENNKAIADSPDGQTNLEDVMGKAQKDVAAIYAPRKESIKKRMLMARVPESKISEALRNLGKRGYVTKADFGWFAVDPTAVAALSDIPEPDHPCDQK